MGGRDPRRAGRAPLVHWAPGCAAGVGGNSWNLDRMGASSLSEDYRLCLERERRRGGSGVCADPTLRAVLWQILVEDFDLHGLLQDDALALFTDGLWGRGDLAPALRNLARAFELLELAAVHLYLFPWRKEFTTIKTFSGGYVHFLKGVLSEDLITKCFQKMGYTRKDEHHLVVAMPPPGYELIQVALGCFALRLECEILGEILTKLGTSLLSAEELIEERRASGDVDTCVDRLRRRLAGTGEPPTRPLVSYPAGIDLYSDMLEEGPEDGSLYGEPLTGPESPSPELAYQPPVWEQSAKLWGTGQMASSARELRDNGSSWESPSVEEPVEESLSYEAFEEPTEERTTFSFIALRRELTTEVAGGKSPSRSPRLIRAAGHLEASEGAPASPSAAGGEPQRYQLHGCLPVGTLPAYCCETCCQLHASHCQAVYNCRLDHALHELLSEKQRRLWLQRTQLDSLLYESPPRARP
ncbi:spermatogenesis-associated protein 2-like protein [Sarcophilus harrisii]|uniref:Spermatosis associated 2 like n=1 Tax=Sarcophilus harrisii TaxID=9305 RepID=A0A7N4PKE7_SARHA|nr:spermatogenesis-associated protein 2-like protein [Sarcophilus harrisii]